MLFIHIAKAAIRAKAFRNALLIKHNIHRIKYNQPKGKHPKRPQTRHMPSIRFRTMYRDLGLTRSCVAQLLHVSERTIHNFQALLGLVGTSRQVFCIRLKATVSNRRTRTGGRCCAAARRCSTAYMKKISSSRLKLRLRLHVKCK
jgi:DNA-binding transcriptional regulator YiaG